MYQITWSLSKQISYVAVVLVVETVLFAVETVLFVVETVLFVSLWFLPFLSVSLKICFFLFL